MPTEVQLPAVNVQILMAAFVVFVLSQWYSGTDRNNLPLGYLFVCAFIHDWLQFAVVSVFLMVGMFADAFHNVFR